MKLGLVIYGALETITGGYVYDRMLVSYLRRAGDDVEVLTLNSGSYARNLRDNLTFRIDGHYDAVLQDELCHPSLLAQNARERTCPTISIVHNLRSAGGAPGVGSLLRKLERKYLGGVDGFVFNSRATADSVSALIGTLPPHVIAPPGGDRLGEFSEGLIRARACQPGPLRLLFLANVLPGKGLDVLLDALKMLPPSSVSLEVVGSCNVDSAYARRMQKKASQLGVPIFFRGALQNGALKAALEQAQAMVLPSHYEGFGIAYLEGMAFGLPALGTTAGGIPELVSDRVDGFLIAPGDAVTLSGHLVRLAADRRLLAQMGVAALRKYKTRPSWTAAAQLIRGFLVGVLKRAGLPNGERERQSARS